MNLFGKKQSKAAPAAVVANPADTIKLLRDSLDTLEKREIHIGKRVDMALLEAKQKAAKKDKRGALFALKRKKLFEGEVMKLQGARITLDSQISALESAVVNIQTFQVMARGAQALKGIRGNIDADRVDDMMDEMQEERDIHDQISDAISRPVGDPFDDDELLQELADLEELELSEEPVYAPPTVAPTSAQAPSTVFSLPTAPTTPIKNSVPKESEEEMALRELQASMLA